METAAEIEFETNLLVHALDAGPLMVADEQHQEPRPPLDVDSHDSDDTNSGSTDLSTDSDSESLDSEGAFDDDNDDNDEDLAAGEKNKPELSIMSCFLKHNLSGEACKDILNLMKQLHLDSSSLKDINYATLWSIAGESNSREIHYCQVCNETFPGDEDQFQCATANCRGLRYLGTAQQQIKKGRRARTAFIMADVAKQLKDILETEGTCARSQTELSKV